MKSEFDIMGMSGVDAPDKPNRYEGATVTSPPEDYRLIPLTQGQFAKVSPEDYERLVRWKWYARWNPTAHTFYAERGVWVASTKKTLIERMHRIILGLEREDKREGDHINGDGLDNSRSNLRIAEHHHNARNRGAQANNTSGFKGVFKHRNKWAAQITVQGKRMCLGISATPEGAAELYRRACESVHGEFARTK